MYEWEVRNAGSTKITPRPATTPSTSLPQRTLDSFCTSLAKTFNPVDPLSKAQFERLKAQHSLVAPPLVARTRLFDPTIFSPPDDISHQMFLNITKVMYTNPAVWLSLPNARKLLAEASGIAETLRHDFPTLFGNYLRNTYEKHNSNCKMFEWTVWVFHVSVPMLNAVGFNHLVLRQWTKFAGLACLCDGRGAVIERELIVQVGELAAKFVAEQEKLWVEGELSWLVPMPVVLHRLLHLANSLAALRNLTKYWQLPLERKMATQVYQHQRQHLRLHCQLGESLSVVVGCIGQVDGWHDAL